MRSVKIWTDGSATIKEDRKGGSGVYMKWDDGLEVMLSKGWRYTKTGRAEIHAFLLALKQLDNIPTSATFYMDSEYVMKSVIEYMPSWLENDWMGSAGPVKNKDLWLQVLNELDRTPKVLKAYVHVKGHQDRMDDETAFGNSIADYLANYKTQERWEDDVPVGEGRRLRDYYIYSPSQREIYIGKVRRGENDIIVGVVVNEGMEEVDMLVNTASMSEVIDPFYTYRGRKGPSKEMSYYLHYPSRTYFVDEKYRDFKSDSEDVVVVGPCYEATERELEELLLKDHPPLHRTFKSYKLRGIQVS